jgi:rhodanese-related sulfurtransferase
MRHATLNLIRRALWLALACSCAPGAGAVTVAELQKELANGDQVTVIDLRTTEVYSQGHIPGAINIPASLCPYKILPPLGHVIVCDSGLGPETTDAAVAALAQKPGITVDILAGGYAAWQGARGLNTGGRGVRPEVPQYITYAQLKAAKAGGIVLVDLRKKPIASPKALAVGGGSTNEPLTDLSQEFPGVPTVDSPFAFQASVQSVGRSPPLLVLIDSGDGAAQAMGRKLKGNGILRYAILAGGEEILARKGQPGLQRKSGKAPLLMTSRPPGVNPAK